MDNKEIVFEVWKKSIEVQQHFNDIEMKIRNYALSTFTFIVTALGYLIKEKSIIELENFVIFLPSVVGYVGSIIILAFFFMDKYWYHKLLVGAVKQASEIESKYERLFEEMKLTTKIGEENPIVLPNDKEIHSSKKITIFYSIIIHVLIFLASSYWFISCCNHCIPIIFILLQIIYLIYQLYNIFAVKTNKGV